MFSLFLAFLFATACSSFAEARPPQVEALNPKGQALHAIFKKHLEDVVYPLVPICARKYRGSAATGDLMKVRKIQLIFTSVGTIQTKLFVHGIDNACASSNRFVAKPFKNAVTVSNDALDIISKTFEALVPRSRVSAVRLPPSSVPGTSVFNFIYNYDTKEGRRKLQGALPTIKE